ncbi:transglycosylase domain-containing protein [Methylobacterium sp. WSM2598]|uniref:transglycosylase domain-containing protein n=1 Tax=Methylobacterium sp. WSM2598 TaxID=398261 RepID=UPI00039B19FC|nr:transglycosylase domain-containing protein [Methylobacterium sp. WSM2598]
MSPATLSPATRREGRIDDMLAETSTAPERDWLDLGSSPAPAPPPPQAPPPGWSARIAGEAVRVGQAVAARWQPALAARVAPLRLTAGRAGARLAAHPLARRARSGAGAAAERLAALRWSRLALALGLLLLVGCAALLAVSAATLPRLDGPGPASAPVTVRAEDGEVLATRGSLRGRPLPASAIAPAMRRAIIAAQDPWFMDPHRLDAAGVAAVIRGAFRDTISPGPREGSARLTQRLVRTQLLGGERGLVRKLQEAMLVLWLQARASPDEIVARFLSGAAFGPDLIGLDAASERLLGKAPRDLTTAEAALLAGLTLPPADLRPDRDVEASRARARGVLDAMVMTGAITRLEAEEAGRALAAIKSPTATAVTRSGVVDLAVLAARDRLGDEVRNASLRISLDRSLQSAAEAAVNKRLDAAARNRGDRAGLVVLGPDGAILAAVSGGSPLAADPAGRAAAEASLRRVTRDGRPVYDRPQAATLDPATVRARAFALLSGLARLPEGVAAAPAARDGLAVGPAGDVTLGVWVASEDEGAASAGPSEIFQDLAAKLRDRSEPPPRGAAARRTWQPPEEPRHPPPLRGTARVVDTGRLKVEGQPVRLFGVEGQGGRAAREFRQYLRQRDVSCEPAGEAEVYRCRAGSQDLSEVVLFNGAGRAAPGATPELLAAEANARARKAGIWQE